MYWQIKNSVYVCVPVCECVHIVCACVYVYSSVCLCVYESMYVHLCAHYMNVYVCAHVHLYSPDSPSIDRDSICSTWLDIWPQNPPIP